MKNSQILFNLLTFFQNTLNFLQILTQILFLYWIFPTFLTNTLFIFKNNRFIRNNLLRKLKISLQILYSQHIRRWLLMFHCPLFILIFYLWQWYIMWRVKFTIFYILWSQTSFHFHKCMLWLELQCCFLCF